MCDVDPQMYLEAAKFVFNVAKTVITGVTVKKKMDADAAALEYKAKVAKENAKIAQENAAQERQSGLEEARLQRLKTIQTIGAQQTAIAANGLDVTNGTALDIIEDSAQMGELDALMTQYNSERAAYNYEVDANNYLNQANLNLLEAKNARTSGNLQATTAIIGGLADIGMNIKGNKVSSKWSLFKDDGKPTGWIPSSTTTTEKKQLGYTGTLPLFN